MPRVVSLDHVQLAMPPGQEERARDFYDRLLGIPEVPKPPVLAARGGAWFEAPGVKLHLGVEQDFRAAKKAHPALVVSDLEALVVRLREAGAKVTSDDALPELGRYYVEDPFGNRLELLPLAADESK